MAKKKLLGIPLPVFVVIVVLVILLFVSLLGGPIGSKLLKVFGIDFNLPEWASVPTPKPELPAEPLFHVGIIPVTNTLVTTWITIGVILLFGLLSTRKMKLVPSRLQVAFEYVVSTLLNLCEGIAGPKYGRQVFPIVATIFLFVFINAWSSLIPGYGSITLGIEHHGHLVDIPLLRGANTDINVPLALALVAFFTVWVFGFKASGIRYMSQFIQTKKFFQAFKDIVHLRLKSAAGNFAFGILDFFVGILEFISQFIRLVSFTFRLFGNMLAGEILLLSVAFLVPWVLSVAIYGLEMLVGFVQALAFGLLTLIFTSMAVAGHDQEEHGKEASAVSH
ncbi:MAG TPA: F0F1 ATP synthase subunit A [Dehalococcoidales bacterium]|nr:F0F1 ATP synthase subunit A [Dehalococcoidales bacterium]